MKKLFTLLLAGSMFTTATFAQAKTMVKQDAKKAVTAAKPVVAKKMESAKVEMKKVEAAKPVVAKKMESAKVEMKKMDAPKPASKMKADGTPDMRLKENKKTAAAAVKPAAKMKADGTPDMRFKENKKTASPCNVLGCANRDLPPKIKGSRKIPVAQILILWR